MTEKQMYQYIKHRVESITSPIAYQLGFETKLTAYSKLIELHALSYKFNLGLEEEIEKAMKPYEEHFRREYERIKRQC